MEESFALIVLFFTALATGESIVNWIQDTDRFCVGTGQLLAVPRLSSSLTPAARL
jgi:hypothetical protein